MEPKGRVGKKDKQECETLIGKHGLSKIPEFLKAKLGQWQDVVINIGITGDSGVGKSSFINAIRGIPDDDEQLAAKTGVTETTTEVASYPYPTNSKITIWDLPGIGTPNYPVSTYCQKVGLEKYDTFLILTAGRFTENDLHLAMKVKSFKKSFFFIRTKIDNDYRAEKRKKTFNEKVMLSNIVKDCCNNLKGLQARDKKVFLVSNHHPEKWDFPDLQQAILDTFPDRQKECLTLSLDLMSSHIWDILERKVEALRGRIWKVAAQSAVGGIVPIPMLSIVVDVFLIKSEVNFYKLQLGIPDENSELFVGMTAKNQEIVRKYGMKFAGLSDVKELAKLIGIDAVENAAEEVARFIPFVGLTTAGGISYYSTRYFLNQCLDELKEIASEILIKGKTRAKDDLDID